MASTSKQSAIERLYQREFIKKLRNMFPDSIVVKNDPNYMQGIPDILMLVGKTWAAFEVKASARSDHQPNQDYYVDRMNGMSFAAFVHPGNEGTVLDELQRALQAGGTARVSKRK